MNDNNNNNNTASQKSPLGGGGIGIKAIIFDLDGTLLDSVADIALANNSVLEVNGLPGHAVEKYIGFIGNGARRLVQLSLPENRAGDEKQIDFFLAAYKKAYMENIVVESKLYNGIPELLTILNEKEIPLAINTNKPHDQTLLIAGKLLSAFKFEKIIGQRDKLPKKPNPQGALQIAKELSLQPSEILFIGDSEVDVKTALAAKVQLVCVTWGYSLKEEMVEAGCTHFVDSAEELKIFIEKRLIK